MSRFNFGNRKNEGSGEQQRYEREVYFNRPSGRAEDSYSDEHDSSQSRINERGNERTDHYRQYPSQQDHPYFKGHAENGGRNQIGTRQDFQHLRTYGKSSHPDELKGLSFWRDEEDDLHDDDPENWSDRSSPLKFVIAISGIAVFSAIAWFSYRWVSQTGNDTPPLIQAEQGPYKVRPENPGGISIPHQDKLIYGRLSGESDQPVERLLPPPEQTVVIVPPQHHYADEEQAPHYVDPEAHNQQHYEQAAPGYQAPQHPHNGYQPYPQGSAPVYQYHQQQPEPSAEQQAYRAEAYPQQMGQQPHQGQGYPPQPQGPAIYPAHPQTPPTQSGQYPNYANMPASQPQPTVVPSANRNPGVPTHRPTESSRSNIQMPALKETADRKPVMREEERAEATAISSNAPAFFVQLATLPTEQLAKQEADRLSKKYKHDLLGNEMTVRMVEKVDGTKSFRVIAGPFKTRNIALAKSGKFGSGSRVVQLQSH